MTQEEAIRIIAIYDGWRLWHERTPTLYTDQKGGGLRRMIGDTDFPHFQYFQYHTSADALLPVWRKVYEYCVNKCDPNDTDKWVKLFGNSYLGISGAFDVILYSIGMNKLNTACLKLAEIIEQLNEQK